MRAGNLQGRDQVQDQATYWRKRTKSDGIVDWRMNASSIYNLVRALNPPYPGASFKVNDGEVGIIACEIVRGLAKPNDEPGKIIAIDGKGVTIKAGKDAIKLTKITREMDFRIGDYL